MPKEKIITDARDLIVKKMKDDGRKFTWLSEATGISYDTLDACLKRKLFSLSQENLDKINTSLETDFKLPE